MALSRVPWVKQRVALLALSRGATIRQAAVVAGLGRRTVDRVVAHHGRVILRERTQRPSALSSGEREQIYAGIVRGDSDAVIARCLGRHRGTVGREIKACGGRGVCRPFRAQDRADRAARRSGDSWWQTRPWLWAEVCELLITTQWSPQQICERLRVEHPGDPHWWVSHESIYQAIYVQTLPELRKQLTACMRSGQIQRRSQTRRASDRARNRIHNMVSISERPPEVEDRAVPGHWEGDLIVGKYNRSAVATLVERTTGFGMLIKVDSRNAVHVGEQIAKHMTSLAEQVRLSLTWDQGIEMADHQNFTVKTGIPVYFCDPRSPWQRGTNENWNGLVRQYLPKGTDLSVHSQKHLDMIAAKLNDRPRKRFNYDKPVERFNKLVAPNA